MICSEFAPAKINLFLDVLRKRPDGYHDIGTLFQTIGTGDTLRAEIERSGEIRLSYDQPQEYPVQSDLVYKAAELLKKEYGVRSGVRLHLEKRLPLGAGLGGGSADAAATLRLLNRIWGLRVTLPELARLGARLGADVPFLVEGGTALAGGIGDQLEALPPACLPEGSFLLVATPRCAVPTAAAYGGIAPSGTARWDAFQASIRSGVSRTEQLGIEFDLYNKFEESVFPKYAEIPALKARMLECGAQAALMSGSGASVFAIYSTERAAREALRDVGGMCRWGCVTTFFFPKFDSHGATAL